MREIDTLPVPRFNFAAIKARSERRRPLRRRAFVTATLALLVPALAFGALQFVPFKVTHKYGMWQVYPPSHVSRSYRNPTQATLIAVGKRAHYRVIWPIAMPKTSVLENLGDDASQMFTLVYRCPDSLSGYSAVVIMPNNYSAIDPNLGKWFYSQTIRHGRILKWRVGDQLMLLESTCLSDADLSRVREATMRAGATQR